MPKEIIDYNINKGEWYPYSLLESGNPNYEDRRRSMFFFKSLDSNPNSTDFGLTLTSGSLDTQFPLAERLSGGWPLDSSHGSGYSDGSDIYEITCTNRESMLIKLHKPVTSDAVDLAIYNDYVKEINGIIVEQFESFTLGFVLVDPGNPADTFNLANDPPSPRFISNKVNNETDDFVSLSFDFTEPLPAETPELWTVTNGTISWGTAEYEPVTLTGNFVLSDASIQSVGENQHFSIFDDGGTKRGNYFSERAFITVSAPFQYGYKVTNLNSFDFPNETFANGSIQNRNQRPRLRIKYTVPADEGGGGGGGSDPNIYTFYREEGNYGWSSAVSRFSNLIANDDYYSVLVEDDEAVQSLIQAHEISFNRGVAGVFPFALNSDLNETGTRTSTWRKAYRFLSRFRPKMAHLYYTNIADGERSSRFTLSNISPQSTSEPGEIPLAISHKPPCFSPTNEGDFRKGLIIISNEAEFSSSVDGDWTGPIQWPGFPSTENFYTMSSGEGLNFEENLSPNTITFTAETSTGVISCDKTVIPAYSGEILYWDESEGFIKRDYTLPSGGIARTAVFIDITETDEVLRWTGQPYSNGQSPIDVWQSKISRVTINNGSDTITLNNYELLKDDKDNYVIIAYGDDDILIEEGYQVRVKLVNRRVISNWQDSFEPVDSQTIYEPLQYRTLEEEILDDVRVSFVPSTLSNFTITSDGTVDGNITINYDGDVPDGTQFRLFIQEDEEGTP